MKNLLYNVYVKFRGRIGMYIHIDFLKVERTDNFGFTSNQTLYRWGLLFNKK